MNKIIKPVLILGLHYVSLQIARSLGKKEIPVWGIDYSSKTIGECSKHINKIYCPEDETDLIQFLIDHSNTIGNKIVLFPTSDEFVLFVLKYKKKLSGRYLFPLNLKIVHRLINKTESANLFTKFKISCPVSVFVKKGNSSLVASQEIKFPCILKPDYHDCWEKEIEVRKFIGAGNRVCKIESTNALNKALKKLCTYDNIVIQEFIPGPSQNNFYYVGYRNHVGKIAASYISQKIRTFPDGMGSETLSKTVHKPELRATGDEFLNKLDYHGPAGIEFKYDPRDKKPS